MKLDDVFNALDAGLTGEAPSKSIDLHGTATQSASLTPLVGVLSLFRITDSYVLSRAQLSRQGSASIELTGDATFAIPGATANLSDVAVRLVCTADDDDTVRFELSLAITDDGWTFSSTFPVLPPTQRLDGKGVVFKPSFLVDLPLANPVFRARDGRDEKLQLTGELWPEGSLSAYETFFKPWPLRLSGSVTLPEDAAHPPTLDLTAVSPSANIDLLGAVKLHDVGLRLFSVTDLDPEVYPEPSVSSLELAATLFLGQTDPITAHLSVPLLEADRTWFLSAVFEDGEATLAQGLVRLAELFQLSTDDLVLPAGFDDLTSFFVQEIDVGLNPPTDQRLLPQVEHVAVTIGSKKEWNPPIPFVRIRDVGTRWVLTWAPIGGNENTAILSGSVYGTLVFGGEPPPSYDSGPILRDSPPTDDEEGSAGFSVWVNALIPQFVMTGQLLPGEQVPIGAAFRSFFGKPGPPTPADMVITDFSFEADPRNQTYDGSAEIAMDWKLPLGDSVWLTLQGLSFRITATQGAVTGGIDGTIVLTGGAPEGLPDPQIVVGAEFTGSDSEEGWIFSGLLTPGSQIDLVNLVIHFLGKTPPSSLPSLIIDRLAGRYETGTKAYMVAATVAGRWTPTVLGQKLTLSALAMVDVQKPAGATTADVALLGRFSVNKIAVSVGINLKANEPTYLFKVEFGSLWLSAISSWRGEAPNRHQVLTIQLGGTTLGAILEYLVNLAAPTLGFALESPFDLLNRIELSRFTLTIDPTEQSIDFTFRVDAELLAMRVDTVGVRYRRVEGEGKVELLLTGRLLDKVYSAEAPLTWDVIRDPPPAVPGQGSSLIDLRYLGLGQHVTVRDADTLETVSELLARMKQDMQPPSKSGGNPLQQPSGSNIVFAPERGWLIGLEVGLVEMVSLGLVFNDPRLYGVSIGLSGEKAGALAGLRFELLYRKFSDTLGVFRIELRMPEAFRRFELGAVSLTLGVAVVEIFTNGNFSVDLGFPWKRDFSRSFTVAAFPFIGRGGLYFALLDGQTSSRVPSIVNGTFAPVLELGVGLALGVGKELSAGPFSGGIFVEVEALFQGVLAWFNPSSSGTPPALYYWAQAVAAIHGKLYGKVDFKVIKASFTAEAFAQASVTFEAFQPTVFKLEARVRVEAEAKVFFVKVHFSHEVNVSTSFTLGREQPLPWLLAQGQGTPTQQRLRRNVLPPLKREPERRSSLLRAKHLARLREVSGGGTSEEQTLTAEPYALSWDPRMEVFSEGTALIPVTMLPAFSITGVPVGWAGAPSYPGDPRYQVAFLLFIPTGQDPAARSVEDTLPRSLEESAHARWPGELGVERLMEAFLRWAISAVTGVTGGDGQVITAGQLCLLTEQLDRPEIAEAFSLDHLSKFFGTNLLLIISGAPVGSPNIHSGVAFPVPPFLFLRSRQAGDRDLQAYNPVGPLYEHGVDEYVARLFPLSSDVGTEPEDDPAKYESFATFVFRDWCLMVTHVAVQAARDCLTDWKYTVDASSSLSGIAQTFPTVELDYAVREGDTLDSVAEELGATPAELVFLNPGLVDALEQASAGGTISVKLGISPEVVGMDNADVTLAPGLALEIGAVEYQVAHGDTLGSIAARFGQTGAEALFEGTNLADAPGLLREGASFQIPEGVYTPPSGVSTLLTAAIFYVRYFGRIDVPNAGWYAETIFQLNADGALQSLDAGQPIPAGTLLAVPSALNDTSAENATTYTTLPGDTLLRIGAALALAQNHATGEGPDEDWPVFREQVQPSGSGVSIPAATVTVLPGESVALLEERTLIHSGSLSDFLGWVEAAPILAPLAVVLIPRARATTGSSDTLASVARLHGLSVQELATRLREVSGLFPVLDSPLELTVSHLPVQGIDTLVAAVIQGPAPSRMAGLTSRQLLSGLRLPRPERDGKGHKRATGPLTALYELTGQQLPGPIPDLWHPGAEALKVTVLSATDIPWIRLMGSTIVRSDDTLESLAERVPGLEELNPAIAEPGRLRPGMVVTTGSVSELVFRYSNAELAALYPASELRWDPVEGPRALPLLGTAPRTYGLNHRIELQSPFGLPIPLDGTAPLTGASSLWAFPEELLARARAASSTPYELLQAEEPLGSSDPPSSVISATFAMLASFTIRRLEGSAGVYALLGADSADRALLLALWEYLTRRETPLGTAAFLLIEPVPDAGNSSGLAALQLNPEGTFIVNTNGPADRTESAACASISELDRFVLLLWEASANGGAGSYLALSTLDGKGVPASAFDADGEAVLRLLVIPGEQQGVAPDGRPFLAFNNCAAVGPGLDPSVSTLWVEASDGSERVMQATVPPGHVGFTLTLPRPAPDDGDSALQLQELFSLVTYELTDSATSPFQVSPPGLPLGPRVVQDRNSLSRQRPRAERRFAGALAAPVQASESWRYEQVLPVARFGPPSVAPAVAGLPDPAGDPYRGIGGQHRLPSVGIQLGFADLLGNVTAPPDDAVGNEPHGRLSIPVGYTDALIGVGSWPAVTLHQALSQEAGAALLTAAVVPQPSALMPAPDQSPATAVEKARGQAEQYRKIYFQVTQPAVTASLRSSLLQGGDGQALPQSVDMATLWRLAAASYVYAQATASLLPASPDLSALGTLEAIVQGYGLSYESLARTNEGQPAVRVLGTQPVTMPAYVVFAEHDTAESMVAAVEPGWPTPAPAELLALDENAQVLPLRPGVVLRVPATQVLVPGISPTPSLEELARQGHTSPGMLAEDNASSPGLLQQGFVFTMEEQTVTVGVTTLPDGNTVVTTFDEVRQAFAAIGVNASVGDIAAVHASRTGMLEPDVALASVHYIAGEDETLASNASGATVAQLASENKAVPDLFDAGALVFFGSFSPSPTLSQSSSETLQELADRYGTPPALLLSANASRALPTTSTVTLPGTLAMPEDVSDIHVPYTLASSDTLESVASRFAAAPGEGTAAERLTRANLAMPGVLAAGKSISVTVGGTTYQTTTVAGDSFQAVLGRLQAQSSSITLAQIVEVISLQEGFVQPGALLVCPPAKLGGSRAELALTPSRIPSRYGISVTAFAQANAALLGLISAQAILWNPKGTISITTGTHETFNSIASRFAAAGEPLSISEIVTVNVEVPFLRAGALALLPPVPVTLAPPIVSGSLSSPVFPLTMTLQLARPPFLVAPEFRTMGNDGPVERADTAVPVPVHEQGEGADGSLTLAAFAEAFHRALPGLRLATGTSPGNSSELWVVNFQPGGISQVTVRPAVPVPGSATDWPRFFALRPLYSELVTRRQVPIQSLREDGSLSSEVTPMDYQGIDGEIWARRFLADIDRFLSVPYVSAAYASPAARGAVDKLLRAKQRLSRAIPRGLATVLALDDPKASQGWSSAVEALEQQTAMSLSRAYELAAILQYDASVNSAWTMEGSLLKPARLRGVARSLEESRQPYALTSAETALDRTDSYVNFLMNVTDPSRHSNVEVALDYDFTELEFNITNIAGLRGYEASDVLSFISPLEAAERPASVDTHLGDALVPVPLRAYPSMPVLLGQSARPAAVLEGGPRLADTGQWTYSLTYSHEHAEQDEVLLSVAFNLTREAALASPALDATEDIASALARYIEVADPLWALLSGFTEEDEDPLTLAIAANTFADLVAEAAIAWERHWQERRPGDASLTTPARRDFSFRVRLKGHTGEDGVTVLSTLLLVSEQGAPGPDSEWPDVFVRAPDGTSVALIPDRSRGRNDALLYRFPAAPVIPADEQPVITVEWSGLNVAFIENARASLAVRRNQKLLGEEGPNTSEGFLYGTGRVEALDIVTPLNVWPQSFELQKTDTTLEHALESVFSSVLAGAMEVPISMGMFYSFEIVPADEGSTGLASDLPVAVLPKQPLQQNTAAEIATALEEWMRTNSPRSKGGAWVLSLSVFSSIDPGQRPLLSLDRLVFKLAA